MNFNFQQTAVEVVAFCFFIYLNWTAAPWLYKKVLNVVFKVNILTSNFFSDLDRQLKELEKELDEKFKEYLYVRELNLEELGCFSRTRAKIKKFFLEKVIVELSKNISKLKASRDVIENIYIRSIKKSKTFYEENDLVHDEKDSGDIFEEEKYWNSARDIISLDNLKKVFGVKGDEDDDEDSISLVIESSAATNDHIVELIIEDLE